MKPANNGKGKLTMKNIFENLCMMSQAKLKKHLAMELKKTHSDITVADGFVFAKGNFPVLLLAHMDTVHKKLPNVIIYDEENDEMSSPNGIGGDDRCGIYMVLEVIKKFNCSVLFCEDEETGGIGAKKFIQTDLAKELEFNYAIEFDRKGSHDAVFYDCDNEKFEDFICEEFYDSSWGSFSDISVVAPFLKCAAVNLSCGYYNAHTTQEYVRLKEMQTSIDEACKILARTTENDKFEYIEREYKSYRNYSGFGGYYGGYYGGYNYAQQSYYGGAYWDDGYDDTSYYIIEFVNEKGQQDWCDLYATSKSEAVGKFLMRNPDMCYNDITDVMCDK